VKFHRIFDRPGGELLCTVACCTDSPDAALSMARENPFLAQQMTEEACAFPTEEVGGW
jgi:hypothetical protein